MLVPGDSRPQIRRLPIVAPLKAAPYVPSSGSPFRDVAHVQDAIVGKARARIKSARESEAGAISSTETVTTALGSLIVIRKGSGGAGLHHTSANPRADGSGFT